MRFGGSDVIGSHGSTEFDTVKESQRVNALSKSLLLTAALIGALVLVMEEKQ